MRFYPTLSKDDNTTCSDMILLGVHLSGQGFKGVNINLDDLFSGGFESIFSGMFGGGHSSRSRRGNDVLLRHEVTLEQIFNEDEIEISAKLSAPCESCNGSGAKSPDDVQTCSTCNGQGRIVQQARSRTLCPTNGFRLPRLWWAGKSFESRVRNVEGSVPFKKCRRCESKFHGVLKMAFDFVNEARGSLCKWPIR